MDGLASQGSGGKFARLTLQVIGLSLAAYNIFILPLDAANTNIKPASNQISLGAMSLLTVSFYSITMGLSFLVIPFTVFWYEGLDDDDNAEGKAYAEI